MSDTALVHGVVSGVGYLIFGVPAPFLWAVATAFASFIPLFGTALVSVSGFLGSALIYGLDHYAW